MLEALQWYVAIQVVGLACLPLTLRALRSLPDRGWAFARPLGLFVVGYVLWLGTILGLLDNVPATAVVLVALLGVGTWLGFGDSATALAQLWRERRRAIITTEALFLLAFAAWTAYRAFVPEIANTEKPMEFAFLNSVLRSQTFPPADPWLSGYSISYYYFGYVLTAIMTELSAVPSSVAFNLMIATLFALTATGAFSLGYNLVAGIRGRLAARAAAQHGPGPTTFGLVASVFMVLLSNWEGLIEVVHAHGIGSTAFWNSLGIHDLGPAFVSPTLGPTEALSPWWWFRASRVIATYTANGKTALDYTINEFPFFSFLLGDLHPHVLSLPYTMLALAFALAMVREVSFDWSWLERDFGPEWLRRSRIPRWIASYIYYYPREALRREPLWTLVIWVFFGGLSFLNAWDLPTYLFILVGAFALRRYLAQPLLDGAFWRETLTFAWVSLLGGVVLYLPFYITFSSQTQGIGLVPIRSNLLQFLIFWGPLLFVVGSFLVVQLARTTLPERSDVVLRSPDSGSSWNVWGPVLGFAALLLVIQLPPIAQRLPIQVQAPVLAVVVPMLAACVVLLRRYLAAVEVPRPSPEPSELVASHRPPARIAGGTVAASIAPEHAFVLFLAFTALLLIFGTEVVFIRDYFGDRMNTVFKLYYQAWTLLAIVAAYGVYYLLGRLPKRGAARVGALTWVVVGGLAISAALVYVPTSLQSRMSAGANPPTLDGMAYMATSDPADYAAIQWLRANVRGQPIIVEATGGSYTEAGRISENTGLPTMLGWEFHEQQWRGSISQIPQREAAINEIYQSTDVAAVASLLAQYHVTYVYVGPLEEQTYGGANAPGLTKFSQFMNVVYQQDGVTIYQVKG